jgi:hypothetical protein
VLAIGELGPVQLKELRSGILDPAVKGLCAMGSPALAGLPPWGVKPAASGPHENDYAARNRSRSRLNVTRIATAGCACIGR